jgi:hypothetical protein
MYLTPKWLQALGMGILFFLLLNTSSVTSVRLCALQKAIKKASALELSLNVSIAASL